MTMELIEKSAIVAEIEKRIDELYNMLPDTSKVEDGIITISEACNTGKYTALESFKDYLDTLDVKEVDIASMADEYCDALIKEAEMDVDMAGHCRLAYYNGCKDVLNKIQKGD